MQNLDLKNKTVFITGVAGFIGSNLAERLLKEIEGMQAVQTNIIGTDNVLHAAIDAGVKRVVCLSTDKAAYPINAMGISKAMMEHVIYANARVAAERGGTTICCTRYGNVMCSRGSVIPLFIDQIKAGNPITITDPSMTRFLMNLDEAVDLVMFAFQHANPGDLFIQKRNLFCAAFMERFNFWIRYKCFL